MNPVRIAAFVLTATLGCASGARHTAVADEAIPDSALALEVDNRNWSDVLISIVHDGSRSRFVEVAATHSLTVAIPPRFVGTNGTVAILLHRIGGVDDYLMPAVSIRTGNTVNLTIESDLNRSSIGVW